MTNGIVSNAISAYGRRVMFGGAVILLGVLVAQHGATPKAALAITTVIAFSLFAAASIVEPMVFRRGVPHCA